MPAADDKLIRLAEAVADRTPVDWDRESGDVDDGLRRKIRRLRVVQQIEQVHRTALDPLPGDETKTLDSPRSWGSLRILKRLDGGGFGDVFRARDEALDTDVALKLLRTRGERIDSKDERFLSEARKLARVRHPNVLVVHGVAVHDGVAGLWTELIEGMTLERCLEVQGPFGAQEAALVGIDLCRALSAVHAAGLVHRDVKTNNVMREKGGRIVLLDFSCGSEKGSRTAGLAGTPFYMAPELLRDQDSGVAADVYALGVLLYRLVTRRFPLSAQGIEELEEAHRRGASVRLLDARADLPLGFVRIVERAIDADPARRYTTVGEMEQDLARFVGAVPGHHAPPRAAGSRRAIGVAVAAALLVALGVAAAWAWRAWSGAFTVEASWIRVGENTEERLRQGSELASGDCLELEIAGSKAMHVYVLNEDRRGSASVLYPLSSLDLTNPLPGGAEHRLPGTVAGSAECWHMGGGGGEEVMVVVASREPLPELEREIAALPRAGAAKEDPHPDRNLLGLVRGVTGLAPQPNESRVADLSDRFSRQVSDRDGLWVWEVRFKNQDAEAGPESRMQLGETGIEDLEDAVRERPDDPRALSDLAIALLLDDNEPERLADHVRAYELASRASELDAALPSACRARALALERMFLFERATATWNECLTLDLDASSAASIRARLTRSGAAPAEDRAAEKARIAERARAGDQASVQEMTARSPHLVYEVIADELFPAWADRSTDTDRRALELLAAALSAETGDPFTADGVAAIARAESDPRRLERLVDGHRALREAAPIVRAGACTEAEPLLRRAEEGFHAASSPYRLEVGLRQAICDYQGRRYATAAAILEPLRIEAEAAHYLQLVGSIRWMEALVEGRQAKLSAALHHYEAAARAFEAVRDPSRVAGVRRLIAEVLDSLGEFDQAWRERHQALGLLAQVDDPRSRHQVLFGAAQAAFELDYPRAALAFEAANVDSARDRGDAVGFVVGSVRQAIYLDAAGRHDDAANVLIEARSWLPRVAESAKPELEADVAVSEGRLFQRSDPDVAVRALDRAIQFYEEGEQVRLAELYPLRGRANLEAGALDRAEADLFSGIRFFESNRKNVLDPTNRISHADVARGVYDEMIRFQVAARHRPETALEFAERGRARLLLEQMSGAELAVLDARQIRERTPAGVALAYYAVLDDRLLIWIAAEGALESIETAIDPRELRETILALGSQLEAGRDDAAASRELYDLLIRPVAARIGAARTLILIPDKTLHLLPFAALADRETGRFLIQDYTLAVSPSATFLLRDTGRSRGDFALGTIDALVVGNPSLDPTIFRNLPDLAGAEGEAVQLGRVYADATVLTRDRATRGRFLEGLGRHSVVHFAGHALANDRLPEKSRLALAPDPETGDSGELFAEDLYGREAGRTRLVVLAACATATGRLSSAEGAVSLARPFLAMGVPAVVATLWEIDDEASTELFVRLHEAYRETGDPLSAARTAQIGMLERSGSARVWAAMQVFVGAGNVSKGGML